MAKRTQTVRQHSAPARGGRKGEGRKPAAVAPIVRGLALRASVVFIGFVLLRFAAAQFPTERLWGLNAAAWLPFWAQALFALLGIAAATPAFVAFSRRLLHSSGNFPAWLMAVGLGTIAAACFWLFRMETYFLGDGAVYLAEHFRLIAGLPVSESVLYSLGSAPLTGWTLAFLARLLFVEGSGLAGNPQFVFWITGAAAGALFVALSLWMSSPIRRCRLSHAPADPRTGSPARGEGTVDQPISLSDVGSQWPPAAMLLLFTPGLLLFFGYVEYYTFAYVGIAVTAWLSIEASRGRVPALLPLFTLLLSSALHLMSLVLLPGVLFSLLARWRGAADSAGRESTAPNGDAVPTEGPARFVSMRGVLLLSAAALAAGAVYYFASGIAWEGSRVILSLVPFGEEGAMQHYTLLSSAHLVDVLNMLLFTAGPALLVLPFLTRQTWDAPSLVALTHVLFSFFLMLFGYSGFGMARDWDVTAFFGVVAALLALTLLRREEEARRGYLLHLAAWASVVAVLPWLLVNVDSSRSEQRFRDIMTLDDRRIPGDFALNGYEHLRKYSQSTGDRKGVLWAIGKKIEMVGYPEDFRKYALAIIEGVPAGERAAYWSWMMEELRGHIVGMQEKRTGQSYAGSSGEYRELAIELLTQLGQLPQSAGEMDALFDREATALRALPGNAALVAMAEAQRRWDRTGVFPGGEAFRAAAADIRHSGTLAFYSGRGLLTDGDFDGAVLALEQSLRLDSSFTLPAYYLAEAERQTDPPRIEAAIRHYGLFLSTPERHRIASPEVQRRLIDETQAAIAELELLRLTLPLKQD